MPGRWSSLSETMASSSFSRVTRDDEVTSPRHPRRRTCPNGVASVREGHPLTDTVSGDWWRGGEERKKGLASDVADRWRSGRLSLSVLPSPPTRKQNAQSTTWTA